MTAIDDTAIRSAKGLGEALPCCTPARGARIVCPCLQVTEDHILEALSTCPIRTLKDLCIATQAGQGCMACRRDLAGYLVCPLDGGRERPAARPCSSSRPSP